MIRLLLLSLFVLSPVVLTGCGGGGTREVSLAAQPATARNAEGVQVSVLNLKQSKRYLVLFLDVTNGGAAAIDLRNPGDFLRGFKVEAEGQAVFANFNKGGKFNYWTGYHAGGVSAAAGVMTLAPGATASLELHFKWPKPYLSGNAYPWTLTVSEIYQNGAGTALSPVTLAMQ